MRNLNDCSAAFRQGVFGDSIREQLLPGHLIESNHKDARDAQGSAQSNLPKPYSIVHISPFTVNISRIAQTKCLVDIKSFVRIMIARTFDHL